MPKITVLAFFYLLNSCVTTTGHISMLPGGGDPKEYWTFTDCQPTSPDFVHAEYMETDEAPELVRHIRLQPHERTEKQIEANFTDEFGEEYLFKGHKTQEGIWLGNANVSNAVEEIDKDPLRLAYMDQGDGKQWIVTSYKLPEEYYDSETEYAYLVRRYAPDGNSLAAVMRKTATGFSYDIDSLCGGGFGMTVDGENRDIKNLFPASLTQLGSTR